MRVNVGGKVIPASFLEIEGRGGAHWGERPDRERKGQIEELVGGQNQGPVALLRSKKEQERREQRKCQERSDGEGWVCQGH